MQALSSNINICSEIYPVTDMVKEDGRVVNIAQIEPSNKAERQSIN